MNFLQVYLMLGAIVFLGVAFAYWFVKTGARNDTRPH
jgi:ABC-type uncharacterized transport system permease subunit